MIICSGSWLSDGCCSVSLISASWIMLVGSLIIYRFLLLGLKRAEGGVEAVFAAITEALLSCASILTAMKGRAWKGWIGWKECSDSKSKQGNREYYGSRILQDFILEG